MSNHRVRILYFNDPADPEPVRFEDVNLLDGGKLPKSFFKKRFGLDVVEVIIDNHGSTDVVFFNQSGNSMRPFTSVKVIDEPLEVVRITGEPKRHTSASRNATTVCRIVYSFARDQSESPFPGLEPAEASQPFRSEGLSSQFFTARRPTVEGITNIISAYRIMFFCAPPFSGKTALCTLLSQEFEKNPKISVVHLSCLEMGNGSFAQMFQEKVKLSMKEFMEHRGEPRVLLIDEAQMTYTDTYFWELLKAHMQRTGNLRIILFAAYGSSDPTHEKTGTPITFDPSQVFGLTNTDAKPGLYLKRSEFDEMCANSVTRPIADVIWDLCGCHAGIASAVLYKFRTIFNSGKGVDRAQLVGVANSSRLLHWVCDMRGVPTPLRLISACRQNIITNEDCKRCFEILDTIACTLGDSIGSFSKSPDPEDVSVLKQLVERGFLFEDRDDGNLQYRFASSMHRKAWMFCRYKKSSKFWNGGIAEFLINVVGRMCGKNLSIIFNEHGGALRESQIQQEFFHAISAELPKNVNLVLEWETLNGDGHVVGSVDFNVMMDEKLWFYELLVNGDRHGPRLKRFREGGKYYNSVGKNDVFVLVDFRIGETVRICQDKTIYVEIADDFKSCTIHGFGLDAKKIVKFMDHRMD